MANTHYYSEFQGDLKSQEQTYKFMFHGNEYKFITDAGVFSKNYIDFGSFTMLEVFEPNEIDLPILDIGCGYGPIGIVVSKRFNKSVVMADINERAVALAKRNATLNGANANVLKSNIYEQIDMKFSSIISNPPIRAGKSVVYAIYEGAFDHLETYGDLWVVIQKKQGAPSSMAKLESIFGNCEVVDKSKGYYILKCKKM